MKRLSPLAFRMASLDRGSVNKKNMLKFAGSNIALAVVTYVVLLAVDR